MPEAQLKTAPHIPRLTATLELLLVFRMDGKMVAVEEENGEIRRHVTEPSTRGKSLKAFGAELPPPQLKSSLKQP